MYLYIYKKQALNGKMFMNKKCFFFPFDIFCENFSKIGPIIKKIPKFYYKIMK